MSVQMVNAETFLEIAAFVKMIYGEPLSMADAQRIKLVMETRPPQVDAPAEKAGPFIASFREMLHRVYLQQQ